MHSYLRAIGFSKYKSRRQLEKIYGVTLRNPNRKIVTTVSVDTSLIQFEKDFSSSLGVTLLGEFDINGALSIEHYYPYIKGDSYMSFDNITIEKQTDKESYAGVCEDSKLSMTLIFYVLNIADYAKSKWLNYSNRHLTKVKLSALSTSGTIILGIQNSKRYKRSEDKFRSLRDSFMTATQNGDTEAIENITINEMDAYASLMNRVTNEDILSIVDTSFMPCGVECDHYMIVGNILKVTQEINSITEEKIYNLLIDSNNIILNVGINSLDLQGEPLEGRRFRGEIWLLGHIQI